MTKSDDPQLDSINAALASWRQGDCVLDGEHWFVYRTDSGLIEDSVRGLVVLTQTCDIVRPRCVRPYIDAAPLVEVSSDKLDEIRHLQIPQYAFVPGVAEKHLVADLDRVMTVQKSVVATWPRTLGCSTDTQRRNFAQALTRKVSRFAFPDDFVAHVRKLRRRMQKKLGAQSPEGSALQELQHIRVRASPSWDSSKISLFFWFVCGENMSASLEANGNKFVDQWLGLVLEGGRFKKPYGQLVRFEDMTASDYLESDSLDFGYMSGPDDE